MEQWTQWEPVPGLAGKFVIKSIAYVGNKLIVRLKSQQGSKNIKRVFDECIDSYRYSDYELSDLSLQKIIEQRAQKTDSDWSFFKIGNSQYLKWRSEKSHKYAIEFPFQHICIVGNRDILDVMTRVKPEIIEEV